MKRLVALLAVMATIAGCGGSSADTSKPPSSADLGKISAVLGRLTGYCVQKVTTPGGGDLGQLNADVDLLISEYKAHKDATFSLIPGAKKQTMKSILRSAQSELGVGGCAPDQSQRIEQAISP
jgi:ABC-type glycerol-3-phosphate transport system substrate-binding protein